MKIATWNVNGIRARAAQLLDWLEKEHPDVVCLQELKATIDQVPPSICDLAGYWCTWHGSKAYSGVGLHLSREAFGPRPRIVHPPFDLETRIAVAELDDLLVGSVYVPNGGKDFAAKMAFLEALDAWAADLQRAGRRLVLCGDLNIARTDRDVHPRERKPGIIGQRPDERALLERIIGRGLVDVGRELEPDNDSLFTWWAPWRNLRQRNIGWRLDYVLASSDLAGRARASVVQREVGTSDHAPVVVDFA